MRSTLQREDIVNFTKQVRLSLYGFIEGMTKEKMTKLIVTARIEGTRKKEDHGED
jgi:hypothetical protein